MVHTTSEVRPKKETVGSVDPYPFKPNRDGELLRIMLSNIYTQNGDQLSFENFIKAVQDYFFGIMDGSNIGKNGLSFQDNLILTDFTENLKDPTKKTTLFSQYQSYCRSKKKDI